MSNNINPLTLLTQEPRRTKSLNMWLSEAECAVIYRAANSQYVTPSEITSALHDEQSRGRWHEVCFLEQMCRFAENPNGYTHFYQQVNRICFQFDTFCQLSKHAPLKTPATIDFTKGNTRQ